MRLSDLTAQSLESVKRITRQREERKLKYSTASLTQSPKTTPNIYSKGLKSARYEHKYPDWDETSPELYN